MELWSNKKGEGDGNHRNVVEDLAGATASPAGVVLTSLITSLPRVKEYSGGEICGSKEREERISPGGDSSAQRRCRLGGKVSESAEGQAEGEREKIAQ